MLFSLPDIHTHDPSRHKTAIINISPCDEIITGVNYSVGIHPWHAPETTNEEIEQLKIMSAHTQVVAIGETGLDALKGGDINRQIDLFKLHIALSEKHAKPLIIHAVKTFQQIIELKLQLHPSMPWIIHGFRWKPQLATQFLQHGFYLSLGEKFNPDTAAIIPADRLLTESDESPLPITEIISRIHSSRK